VARLKAMAPEEFEKILAAIDTLAAMLSAADHQEKKVE
jgi:hypothetical protein